MMFLDGLKNVLASLGVGRDKAASTFYSVGLLSPQQLLETYRSSWLARAIVDYPAEDATRKWRQWRAESEQITKIEAEEKRLHLKARVEQAMTAARLYKWAAIYINTGESAQYSPLRVGTPIKSLVVLTSNNLTAGEIVRDIDSEYYGRPEFYTLTSTGTNSQQVIIHASRLAIFVGASLPADSQTMTASQGWGDSVLQSTMDAIKNADATMANIASLVFEAKVDVFKFEGYAEMLQNSANDEAVTRRLQLQAAMKGINGAVVIDAKDDYEQKSASFGGLPEVANKFQETVAGASGIPITRLYGRSSAGLSGSGDGDERVYYDRIGHQQATRISPAIAHLDDCLIYQALGSRPPEIHYEWTPLRQLTENERADIFVKTATAARSLAGANAGELVPLDALSDALVNELTEQGCLPGLEKAVQEYGSLSEQGLPDDPNETPGDDEGDSTNEVQ